jgi:hypothetical protein
MKEFRVDVYKLVASFTEEFSSEEEARKFGAKVRSKKAEIDSVPWENFSFHVEELESK